MSYPLKLYFGDCLELMKLIADQSVDAILCDPPYNLLPLDWDEKLPWDELWKQYKRIATPNAPIILFSSQPFTSNLIVSNQADWRYTFRWIKSHHSGHHSCKTQPLKKVEEVSIFSSRPPEYHPPKVMLEIPRREIVRPRQRSKCFGGTEYKGLSKVGRLYRAIDYKTQDDVLVFESTKRSDRLMPTQKPLAMLKWFLRTYTSENDVVLDSCLGSGTTAVACLDLNRRFIGMEKNPRNYTIALKRIHEHQYDPSNEPPLLIDMQQCVQDNFELIAHACTHLSWEKIAEMLSEATNLECNWMSLKNHFWAIKGNNQMV